MIDLSQVSTQSPFLSSVKFLPSTSNDLTKEQWREETGEGMKERSREKSVTSLIKSIRRLTLKPLLLNRAEKLKSLWWSRLFPGFVFVSFFSFSFDSKALYCSGIAHICHVSEELGACLRCMTLVTWGESSSPPKPDIKYFAELKAQWNLFKRRVLNVGRGVQIKEALRWCVNTQTMTAVLSAHDWMREEF